MVEVGKTYTLSDGPTFEVLTAGEPEYDKALFTPVTIRISGGDIKDGPKEVKAKIYGVISNNMKLVIPNDQGVMLSGLGTDSTYDRIVSNGGRRRRTRRTRRKSRARKSRRSRK